MDLIMPGLAFQQHAVPAWARLQSSACCNRRLPVVFWELPHRILALKRQPCCSACFASCCFMARPPLGACPACGSLCLEGSARTHGGRTRVRHEPRVAWLQGARVLCERGALS